MKKDKELTKNPTLAAVMTRINFQFDSLAKGQEKILDKLDTTNGMVSNNTKDITMLKVEKYGMADDITKINGKLAKIEDDIRVMKTDISVLKGDVSEIKIDLKGHTNRIAHLEEISPK